MIAASTFENILAIVIFGIIKGVTFNQIKSEIEGTQDDISLAIGMIIVQNLVGLAGGIIMGLGAWLFKFIKTKYIMHLKCAYCVVIPVGFIVMFDFTKFNEARFISCFAFGYVCFRFWGNDKPSLFLSKIWFLIQPLLFTPIGSSLLASNISANDIGNSIAIIVVSMTVRVATIFLITLKQDFSYLERLLIGASWLGKGTITAILGGVIYTESLNLGEEY